MKIYFKTRQARRDSKLNAKGKPVDCGSNSPAGRRWAIELDMPKPKGLSRF